MAFENPDRIPEFNPLFPLGSDPIGEGDNHIRGMKLSILNFYQNNYYVELSRSYAEVGFTLRDYPESFETGGTLTDAKSVLLQGSSGRAFSGEGPFPQTVLPNTDPLAGGFTDQSGVLLSPRYSTYIQVDSFIEAAPRVIDGFHAAADYIASIGGGVGILSAKTYLLEDEYIPRSKVILRGQGIGPAWAGATVLKWAGGSGSGKAVVRSSAYPLGTEGTTALSGVGVQNCVIDAEGCDVGLYTYYTVNNSNFDNLVTTNAMLANTYILKSWFTYYGSQQVIYGLRYGLVIGKALYGETGDIAVNACWFDWVRAHSNGSAITAIDPNGLSAQGSGIAIGIPVHACHFPSIQCEGNYGTGLHNGSSHANSFGAVYLEGNCRSTTTGERTGWINVTLNSYAVQSIQSIYLATGETIKNNVDRGLIIQALTRGDNINTFTGTGEVVLVGSNLGVHSATNWTKMVRAHHQLLSAQNINVRFTSSVQGGTRFISHKAVYYPFVTVVPRATVTLANPLVLGIGANPKENYGTSFTAGVPITIRHAGISSGTLNLETGGTLPATDTFFDFYIVMAVMAGGGVQSPVL